MRSGLLTVLAVSLTMTTVQSHVRLMYPPARRYQLDFLDTARTPGPCGMPPGKVMLHPFSDIHVYYKMDSSTYTRLAKDSKGFGSSQGLKRLKIHLFGNDIDFFYYLLFFFFYFQKKKKKKNAQRWECVCQVNVVYWFCPCRSRWDSLWNFALDRIPGVGSILSHHSHLTWYVSARFLIANLRIV